MCFTSYDFAERVEAPEEILHFGEHGKAQDDVKSAERRRVEEAHVIKFRRESLIETKRTRLLESVLVYVNSDDPRSTMFLGKEAILARVAADIEDAAS